MSLTWCAGLFAGEGHAFAAKRELRTMTVFYPGFSVTMLDRGSLEKWAETFDQKIQQYVYSGDPSRFVYRCGTAGRQAGEILAELLPHLLGTAKEGQIRNVFTACDWTFRDGMWQPPESRKSQSMIGNQNARK